MRLIYAALALAGALSLGHARDLGQWAGQPPEVRDWYRDAELTLAARQRFPFVKCCTQSDVVRTQFRVDKVSGADAWWWRDGETWKRVPDDIIHWGEHAPDGQPTLFVFLGKETCFFPGDSGI